MGDRAAASALGTPGASFLQLSSSTVPTSEGKSSSGVPTKPHQAVPHTKVIVLQAPTLAPKHSIPLFLNALKFKKLMEPVVLKEVQLPS